MQQLSNFNADTKIQISFEANLMENFSDEPVHLFKSVDPKLGVNYPLGIICHSLGVTRNQNHNVVLYYEQSLRNIEGNKT